GAWSSGVCSSDVGGVFRVGGGVTPPTVLQRVEPQYSEEARKARYQGTVVLEAIVRKDGTVDIMRIVRSLGFGLDENAIQALKQRLRTMRMISTVPSLRTIASRTTVP